MSLQTTEEKLKAMLGDYYQMGSPGSPNAAILQNMLGADNELRDPQSENEALLKLIYEDVIGAVYDARDEAQAAAEAAGTAAEAVANKAPAITDTASGSIASFPDGADGVPVKSLVVNIEPVQEGSGDPSPDNVRPITGWTGANVTRDGFNVWDGLYEGGYYDISDGEKNGNPSSTTGWQRSKNIIPCAPNTAYRFIKAAAPETGAPGYILFYDRSGNYLDTYSQLTSNAYNGGIVFTTPADCYGIAFYNNIGWFIDHNISINYPATDHDYHAYAGQVIPITWQTEAGTVYGGTVDVTNGVLKSRPYYASYNGETLVGPWVSSMDAYTPGGTPTIGAQVVDLGGAETEYTLTPAELTTLLGQNNIFADCGPVDVEYRADTKLYIKRLTGPTDDDMTADANIAAGTYFMVGNNLFLSTASIAAGEAIVPGTNCTATNLAAALNALNS